MEIDGHFISTSMCYIKLIEEMYICIQNILMGQRKKDVTPLLTHWSYVFLAQSLRYDYPGARVGYVLPINHLNTQVAMI